jgi:hypothetical protein
MDTPDTHTRHLFDKIRLLYAGASCYSSFKLSAKLTLH